ncbi:MAG: Ig-like domain-containing protein [Gemmatimonadaceae bacterium]
MAFSSAGRTIFAAVVILAALACGGDGPNPPPAVATSLTVSPEQALFTRVGDTVRVTAFPKDASGSNVSVPVTWTSSNIAVATVEGLGTTGVIVARSFGTATITATVDGVPAKTVAVRVGYNANATSSCTSPDIRVPRIETQSTRLIIASDVDNPPNGFTLSDYQSFAAAFDSLVWPVLTQNFGTPTDIDNNGKVIAFFTRAVNELTPPKSQSVVGGFFFGRDLFPKAGSSRLQACPSSNEAEMFYMLVPDVTGVVNENIRTVDQVKRLTVGVLGHEFQHLINSSRRLYINQSAIWPETSYMEEGLSHIAEEMLFYEASGGLLPRQNIDIDMVRQPPPQRLDAFNSYMSSNSGRFSRYLKSPHDNAPYQRDDDLETRGAIWSFLRYLADRGTPGTPFSEPVCGEPVVLTVGGRCRIDGAAGAQFNIAAGSSLGEFTIVAFSADAAVSTNASADGSIAVSGPPSPSLGFGGASLTTFASASIGPAVAGLTLDNAFHSRLRTIERRDLPRHVPAARAAYARNASLRPRTYSAQATAPQLAVSAVEAVWSQLVNSNDTGIVNLRGRFGADITGAARDWATAHYVDDIGLSGLPAQYRHPSWNFRSVLPALSSNGATSSGPGTYVPGTYPLKVNQLTTSHSVSMVDGGAAYYRLGVAATTTSTVRFTVNGAVPPANLKLTVVRTK